MATSESLAVVPRLVRSELERVLRAVIRRLPPRVQRLSTTAVESLMVRWPFLSRLVSVGLGGEAATPGTRPTNGGTRTGVVDTSVVERAKRTGVMNTTVVERATRSDAGPPADPTGPTDPTGPNAVTETTAEGLIRDLRDPSAEVAVNAAEALRAHPSDATVAALLGVVENRDGYFSPLVRASAVRTLGALLPIGQGEAIALAVSSVDAEVSLAAIAALVERDDARSVEALLEVLENPRGFYLPLTRRAAARGLLRLEIPHDARLRKLFDDEADEDVRESLVPLFPWITPP